LGLSGVLATGLTINCVKTTAYTIDIGALMPKARSSADLKGGP
jgi:hypothetical protein